MSWSAVGRGQALRWEAFEIAEYLLVQLAWCGLARRMRIIRFCASTAGWTLRLSRNRDALAGGCVGDPCLPPGQLTGVAERLLPAEGGHDADHAQVELLLPPAAG